MLLVFLVLLAWDCAEDPENYVGPRPVVSRFEPDSRQPPDRPAESGTRAVIFWTGCGISKTAYMSKAGTANLSEGAALESAFQHWPDESPMRGH